MLILGCYGTDDSNGVWVVQAGESLDLPWRGTEEHCPQMCFPLSDTTMSLQFVYQETDFYLFAVGVCTQVSMRAMIFALLTHS